MPCKTDFWSFYFTALGMTLLLETSRHPSHSHCVCVSYFSHCCDQVADRRPFKVERLHSGSQFKGPPHRGRQDSAGRCYSHHICIQKARRVNRKWGWALTPRVYLQVTHLLQQSSTSSGSKPSQSHQEPSRKVSHLDHSCIIPVS